MRLIGLAVILALSLTLAPLGADAQQTGKVPRIGLLAVGSASSESTRIEAFRQGLRELGYVEGKNLLVEWRFADGDTGRLPALAGDLVRSNVDIIVAAFMSEILAARQATTVIPIVMVAAVDPVPNGLVASLARPGGNITGMTIQPPEFGGKLVELLKQAVPQLSRLAVVWDPLYPGFKPFYEHAQIAARTLGITLQSVEVQQAGDIDVAFARITKERYQGLTVWPTNVMAVNIRRIIDFTLQNRLPTIYPTRAYMDVGGLMSYSANRDEVYRPRAPTARAAARTPGRRPRGVARQIVNAAGTRMGARHRVTAACRAPKLVSFGAATRRRTCQSSGRGRPLLPKCNVAGRAAHRHVRQQESCRP